MLLGIHLHFLMIGVLVINLEKVSANSRKKTSADSKTDNQEDWSLFFQTLVNGSLTNVSIAIDKNGGVQQGLTYVTKSQIPNIKNYNKETLPKCPDGFTYDEDEFHSPLCYLITEPTPFPPRCPYPNTLNYTFLLLSFTLTKKVWVFAERNATNGFGPLEWLKDPSNSVITSLEFHGSDQANISEKNCLVQNFFQYYPADCADKYPAICFYNFPKTSSSFDRYCKNRFNESCIGNDLSSGPICYCKNNALLEQQGRNTFCGKLAEVKDPSENLLLTRLLSKGERCWIGIRRNENGLYHSWSRNKVDYTFWSNVTDFTKTYVGLGRDGWVLETDGSLTCAICEVTVEDHPQVQLYIKHNKSANVLEVQVTNAFEVFEDVTCFVGDTTNHKSINLRYNSKNFVVATIPFKFDTANYYWCTTLQLPSLAPVYSNTIFVKNTTKYSHEYAFQITVPENIDPYLRNSHVTACNRIMDPKVPSNYAYFIKNVRPIKIINFNEDEGNIQVLCHLNILPSPQSIMDEYKMLWEHISYYNENVTNLVSVNFCLPSNTMSGNLTLHWPKTPLGVTTTPVELCVKENGFPVTRTCVGDFYHGSSWSSVNGTCSNVTVSNKTFLLAELLLKRPQFNLNENLLNITKDTKGFTSYQVHLLSKILDERINANVTEIATTINNIMRIDANTLRESQEVLNSTDIILCNLNKILIQEPISDPGGYSCIVTEKLLIQTMDLNKTNVSGIKVGISESQGFDSAKVNPLRGFFRNQELEENLDLAMVIPQDLHDDIVNCDGSKFNPKVITTIFYDDVFFTEQKNTSDHIEGRIIDVTIPGFNCSFNAPLQVIFKSPSNKNLTLKCASWLYGLNDQMESIHGRWYIEGNPENLRNSTYQMCEFTHVTHFSLLVINDANMNPMGAHKKVLDLITAIGSGLSILGLFAVFATAIVFKSYRSDNAVAINFSLAMTAQIVLLFIADKVAENKVLCTIFGAALHYAVLSQFCWMLIVGVLQYKRLVTVVYNKSPTTNLVVKSCIFAWGIPLIPIITILAISTNNYGKNASGLCYVLGDYFIFGLLLPVTLILFLNLIIFVKIMLSVTATREVRVHVQNDNRSMLQLRVAIMLYFLLGMTWGFGLLAAIAGGVVYSYLFCLTATLQGFMLFLFFIALNESTRSLWINLKNSCCICKNKKYVVNSTTDNLANTSTQNGYIDSTPL